MAIMTFTDRLVQYANRRQMTLVAGTTDVYELERDGYEGTIFQEGTEITAATMNQLVSLLEPTKKSVLWAGASVIPLTSLCYKTGSLVHVDFRMPTTTPIAPGSVVGELPIDCRPSISTGYIYGGVAYAVDPTDTNARSFSVLCSVQTNGQITIASDIGLTMYNATVSFEFFVD